MAHHKRKGPKSTRAGCLLCKPHKRQGQKYKVRKPLSVRRREIKPNDMVQYIGLSPTNCPN